MEECPAMERELKLILLIVLIVAVSTWPLWIAANAFWDFLDANPRSVATLCRCLVRSTDLFKPLHLGSFISSKALHCRFRRKQCTRWSGTRQRQTSGRDNKSVTGCGCFERYRVRLGIKTSSPRFRQCDWILCSPDNIRQDRSYQSVK